MREEMHLYLMKRLYSSNRQFVQATQIELQSKEKQSKFIFG